MFKNRKLCILKLFLFLRYRHCFYWYNDIWLGGVKKAVERYERQFGELKKVPIADGSGTLVIVK